MADRPEVVSSIDLAPTILSAVGLYVPAEMPGVNLLPVATGEKPLDRERIFGESYAHDVANIDDPEETLLFRWVIEGQWKLLCDYDGSRPLLYDLSVDPGEANNLVEKHPERVTAMSKQITEWYQRVTPK